MTTSYVSSGGYAVGKTVSSGNTLEVLSSGTIINTLVSSGGSVLLEAGGVSSDTIVFANGWATVLSGGTENATTVSSGGHIVVSAGGTDSGTTISSSGDAYVYGTFLGGSIVDGDMTVSGPGLVSGTLVTSAGIMDVYSGGTTSAVLLNGGILSSGGIYSPDNEVVMSGGFAKATIVGFLGLLDIGSGATASATDIDLGYLDISAGGTSLSATLLSGEEETAGTSISATVNSGGDEYVDSGGTTSKAMIDAGGVEYVNSDGAAVSTTVFDGGTLLVFSGGVSVSGIIDGGAEYVYSATALSPIISSGTLALYDANDAGGSVITFAGLDATLQLDAATLPTNVIAGFAPTDTIAYDGTVTAATYHAVTSKTGTLTLTDGATTIGTLTLSGSLPRTDFYVTPGGGGLSDVTLGGTPSDFNGDNKSDLVMQNTDGAGIIYTTNGLGVTAAISIGDPGPTWHIIGTADFNGDGQPDLLLQNDNGALVDYVMNGTSITAGYSLGNFGSSWHVRGIADFTGNGEADIVLENDDGAMGILATNGTTITAGMSLGTLPAGWAIEGVGDFYGTGTLGGLADTLEGTGNDAGQPDILVESNTGTLVLYTTSGATITSGAVVGTPGAGYSVAGIGDYNGDGKADILLHNDNGVDVIWEMNGPTVTGSVFAGNPGAAYTTAVAGIDLNGDGASDLVVQNTAASTLVGYTLNTTAAITAGAVLGTPGPGWDVVGSNPTTFIDGTGSNLALTGTPGPDQFNLTSYEAGIHTISSFDPAQDTIALSVSAFPSYATVLANEAPYHGGTFINLSPTAAIVITGITPSQLSAANFVLR